MSCIGGEIFYSLVVHVLFLLVSESLECRCKKIPDHLKGFMVSASWVGFCFVVVDLMKRRSQFES